jgi:tRNA pseudouridine55 synthase
MSAGGSGVVDPSGGASRTGEPLPCGFVVVDKPLGMRSTQVVRWVQGRVRVGIERADWGRVKFGHGGTLDPLATGVMVVMVGKATKVCERVMGQAKEYVAEVDLSRWSPTDDHESAAVEVEGVRVPERARIDQVVQSFVGTIQQTPPAHSAIWVEGERAYDMARRGEAPEVKPRAVRIDEILVLGYEFPILRLRIACGRGTYIRSLARDLGRELSGGGMLNGLRRTRVGVFSVEGAIVVDPAVTQIGGASILPLTVIDSGTDGRESGAGG